MATIHSIGSDPGDDYATPQGWYDDLKGDITGDPNAPYIGELRGETHAGALLMSGSTTDATHYFHIRAMNGAEFKGDFDDLAGKAVMNTFILTGSSHVIVGTFDDYCRIEGFVVGVVNTVTTRSVSGIYVYSSYVIVDSMGVYNISKTVEDNFREYLYGIRGRDTPLTVRNCAIGNLCCENTKEGSGGSTVHGIYINRGLSGQTELYAYNNSIELLTALSDADDQAIGISSQFHANTRVCNNAVGTLVADVTACYAVAGQTDSDFVDYNASSDETAYGDYSLLNIVPADSFEDVNAATMDLHMKSGSVLWGKGKNLLDFPSAPTEDIEGDLIVGPWSIGCDWRLRPGWDMQSFARQATVGQSVITLKEDLNK